MGKDRSCRGKDHTMEWVPSSRCFGSVKVHRYVFIVLFLSTNLYRYKNLYMLNSGLFDFAFPRQKVSTQIYIECNDKVNFFSWYNVVS